jgi:hypothetical protein
MTKKDAYPLPERLEAYDRLVATVPGLERKGATMPYTAVNGHMSSFLANDGTLALRLSGPDRERFIEEHGAPLHQAHGTVLAEYVSVPDALVDDLDALQPWFETSHAHVSSLKPKATKRKHDPKTSC